MNIWEVVFNGVFCWLIEFGICIWGIEFEGIFIWDIEFKGIFIWDIEFWEV